MASARDELLTAISLWSGVLEQLRETPILAIESRSHDGWLGVMELVADFVHPVMAADRRFVKLYERGEVDYTGVWYYEIIEEIGACFARNAVPEDPQERAAWLDGKMYAWGTRE